ncbi:MAG: DUF4493 domain-containing protein [Rikenellaceae bacterium]
MRKYILHIATLLALLVSSCNKADYSDTLSGEYGEGEGAVALNINLESSSRAVSASESLIERMEQNSVLKIYDSSNNLIRRYEPATETPDQIYIVEGDYTATLLIGDESAATFDFDSCTYYGTKEFTVKEKSTSQIDLLCSLINTAVQVTFDDSIKDNFDGGYSVRVYAADSYSDDGYTEEKEVKLEFAESGVGYFIISDDEDASKNLAWQFLGYNTLGGVSTPISMTGVITAPQAQNVSTLKFSYSNYLRVDKDTFSIVIDETTDNYDDSFSFKPQPTIKGEGFELSDTLYATEDLKFNITALSAITYVELQSETSSYVVYSTSKTADAPGVSYESVSSMSGVVTISPEFFDVYAKGGELTLTIAAIDETNSKGEEEVRVVATGITTLTGADYWNNTATISAVVLDEAAESVVIEYRNVGSTDWVSAAAVKSGDNTYSVVALPQWSSSTNDAKLTIYTLANGISSGNSYECRLTVDGVTYSTTTLTSADASQTIANGTMNSSYSCFGTSNSSSTTWGSGNNTFTKYLCTFETKDGYSSAYLKPTTSFYNFAAGNIFYGQFSLDGTEGTVSFGQAFSWTSRPRTFKLKYASTVGTVDYSGDHLSKSDTDPGIIYFAIVDWSSRHKVTSGPYMSSPSGTWHPATQTSTDEGKIIGYASTYITASQSSMTSLELDIHYYDTVTKPTGSIAIVISCSASAYGDYLEGSTSNRMYVADFELGY